jgi:acetyl-CoA carboxylase carboxyl transferase subunit beta
MIYTKQLVTNLKVCDYCGHHFQLSASQRLDVTLDEGSFVELYAGMSSCDPLNFPEYQDKIARDRKKTGQDDALVAGYGLIRGYRVSIGVMEFGFMGGSMGSVVGEKVARLMLKAAEDSDPLVIFTASGGARMQEGLISLMQMAKTCVARVIRQRNHSSFITVATDQTSAGVWASFASSADVILAEPGARIFFAGDRVSQQTMVQEERPANYKTAEFQYENGMIDGIVERPLLRDVLARLLQFSHARREI